MKYWLIIITFLTFSFIFINNSPSDLMCWRRSYGRMGKIPYKSTCEKGFIYYLNLCIRPTCKEGYYAENGCCWMPCPSGMYPTWAICYKGDLYDKKIKDIAKIVYGEIDDFVAINCIEGNYNMKLFTDKYKDQLPIDVCNE